MQFQWYHKLILAILSLTIIGLLVIILWYQFSLDRKQREIEASVIQQKELTNLLMRSSNQYASKEDIEKYIKQSKIDLDAIKKDLDKLNGEIVAVNTVMANSKGYVVTDQSQTRFIFSTLPITIPSNVSPNTTPDFNNWYKGTSYLTISEKFPNIDVPFAEVGFNAGSDKPWTSNVYGRKYTATSIIAEDQDHRHIVYNQLKLTSNDKDYFIKVDKAETIEKYPTPSFSFFNPRLFIGFGAGGSLSEPYYDFAPNLSASFMSYGRYRDIPEWSIFNIGASYSLVRKQAMFSVAPVMYNLGKHLTPLVRNLYIGPGIDFDKDNLNVLLYLKVAL